MLLMYLFDSLGRRISERKPLGEERPPGASTHLPLLLRLRREQLRQLDNNNNNRVVGDILERSCHGTSPESETERRGRKRLFGSVGSSIGPGGRRGPAPLSRSQRGRPSRLLRGYVSNDVIKRGTGQSQLLQRSP